MIARYLLVFLLVAALAGCNSDKTAADTVNSSSPTPVNGVVPPSQNAPPTISGTPAMVVAAGAAYSFTPSATDANGDALTFSVQNKPAWATFNTVSGALTGTPAGGNAGNYASIVISVSDGSATASLAAFSISVTASTVDPSISGKPAGSVVVGNTYAFTPAASDPNGLALTFAIQNKPSWATFNTSTGALSGTPALANVGTTSGIVISVSDGNNSDSLPAFSISVDQSANGSATLSWMPPAQNTDGSALTNLAGYRIYYGTNSASLNKTIQVANAGISTYVISNLSPATWYFSVKAYSSGNVESDFSKKVSKMIM